MFTFFNWFRPSLPTRRHNRHGTSSLSQQDSVRDIISPTHTHDKVQTQLKIGAPDDKFEQEADRVADHVVGQSPVEEAIEEQGGQHTVQRVCDECEEEVRRQPLEEEELPQLKARTDGTLQQPSAVSSALQSGGVPMPDSTRQYFEPRFGQDFSAVRLHTGTAAHASARSLNARAYTLGNNIVFGRGEYAPDTHKGKHLLAHELTHVVQQGATGSNKAKNQVQRLSIDPVGSIETGTCGTVGMKWRFNLSGAAAEDGYLVQQVDVREKRETCPSDVRSTPAKPDFSYWEAWDVNAGETTEHIGSPGFTDYAFRRPPVDTSGSYTQVGKVKFFKRSVTGDLGTFDTPPADASSTWRPGRAGGVPMAGGLPSTYTKPTWWTSTPVEGTPMRWISSWWNCCGEEENHFSHEDAKPK